MLKYLLKKFLILAASLWVVVTLTFILVHSIPGDPFTDEDTVPEEIIKSLKHYYGLDKPLLE
ncbi:MAG: ABC transporter permease, partial [Rhabdochlamydiaceae bacterium]